MTIRGPNGVFVVSLLIALGLQFLPLSEGLSMARPMWLVMVIGYWALYGPNVAVISAALLMGLCCDTLYNTPMGQHVVGFTLLAYTLIRLRSVLGLYAVWQVTLLLMPVWALYAVLMFLFDGMAKHPSEALGRFLPVAITGLCWPPVMLTLDALRGKRMSM